MTKNGVLSFPLIALLTTGCSRDGGATLGQPNGSEGAAVGTSGAADLVSQDAREFIHHVDMVNRAEIDLGRLAVTRGASRRSRSSRR